MEHELYSNADKLSLHSGLPGFLATAYEAKRTQPINLDIQTVFQGGEGHAMIDYDIVAVRTGVKPLSYKTAASTGSAARRDGRNGSIR